MTAEVRRGIVLAVAGLLGGFAMVVALFGTGELLKRNVAGGSSAEAPAAAPPAGSDNAAPLAALTPPPQGKIPAREEGPVPGIATEPAPAAPEGAPTFDIVRVEPDGASVVAGRTVPNAKVELLRDGRPYASAIADASGQFALTPPDLPVGSSEIALRALSPDGRPLTGRESVTVVVAEKRNAKPLIALSAPDAPTRVLSQPGMPESGQGGTATAFAETPGKAPAEGSGASHGGGKPGREGRGSAAPTREAARTPVPAKGKPGSAVPATAPGAEAAPRIVSVDAQEGGRLDVTAQAVPGATLRLYLNDTLVASGHPGTDGRIAFTIGRGVRPGAYQIRIDSVDPAGGKVQRRAEVSFTYPESAATRIATAEKTVGGVPALPAPKSTATPPATPPAAATQPMTGQSAAKPGARPNAPGSEHAIPAGRTGGHEPVEGQAGPSRSSSVQASRQDPRTPESAPEARAAPSLAGNPASPMAPPTSAGSKPDVPASVVPSPGTSVPRMPTPGTPSVAAAGGPGSPSVTGDGATAAALSPKLPEGAAPGEARRTADEPGAGTVFVPEISTARITRGDSLWQISRRTYGKGNRYTVIYDANQEQIRDPDLIYPGQIFVLPKDAPAAADNPAPKRT